MRILLVDDDLEALRLVQLNLEREGFDVQVAENGRQALELQKKQPADLVITDIFMPEMDGMETIDRIKTEVPRTPVSAVTAGWGSLDYLRIARQVGADAALAKPFTPEELLRTVRRVL